MAAIRHSLQQELFRPNDEALYSVVNVAKIGGGKKKKTSFLCATVTKEKPFQVNIYKVQKSDKEVFKKKQTWPLSDLKVVDGKQELEEIPEFDLHFEKCYKWTASRVADKEDFIETLFSLSERYLAGKKPAFVNVSPKLFEGDVAGRARSGTNRSQKSHHATDSLSEGQGDDYQELTPREENDLEKMLSHFEHALGNLEEFTGQLSKELQQLEYLNITALMGSEKQAQSLASLIDRGLDELDLLDERLSRYDEMLLRVSEQMGQMEFRDNRMEVERINNRKILGEVRYIVGKLDISKRHVMSLREGDLYNPAGISDIVSAAKILLEASQTNFNPGITELKSVREQLAYINQLKTEFAARFYQHLDKYISQYSMSDRLSSRTVGAELTLSPHDSVHDDFARYEELMGWLKELDRDKFNQMKKHYEESFGRMYEREIREFIEAAKVKASKGKGLRGGLYAAQSQEGLISKGKSKQLGGLVRSPSKESINSMGSLGSESSFFSGGHNKFAEAFDSILSELEPYIMVEQEFCVKFFHLRFSVQDSESSSSALDVKDGGTMSRSRPSKIADEVKETMTNIFGYLDAEVLNFIQHGEKLDPHNTMYMIVRINNQAAHLMTSQSTGGPPSFLGTMFASWLISTKRLFDKYVTGLCRNVEDTKIHKKHKCGTFTFVTKFEEFSNIAEVIFKGSDRRGDIDKAYSKLIQVMFDNIERISFEHEKIPPEIIMFENYHRLHAIISGLRNQALEKEKKEAKQRSTDAMAQYVSKRVGLPVEKISNFFEGVENCIASGVRMEDVGYQIAYNRQELKNILKEYPAKEIKKGLENLYKKLEKYFSTDNFVQVIWRSLQLEFVQQYERYQDLINKCYPGSNIKMPVEVDEILDMFSNI
ncbi:exocyst complex component 1-like [Rhopilema esculentum]|uniref:exocyst complex component 1-like n=1 Tax=Rhopilema esculentum TaxID=499914 RepID=UPI0031E159FC